MIPTLNSPVLTFTCSFFRYYGLLTYPAPSLFSRRCLFHSRFMAQTSSQAPSKALAYILDAEIRNRRYSIHPSPPRLSRHAANTSSTSPRLSPYKACFPTATGRRTGNQTSHRRLYVRPRCSFPRVRKMRRSPRTAPSKQTHSFQWGVKWRATAAGTSRLGVRRVGRCLALLSRTALFKRGLESLSL